MIKVRTKPSRDEPVDLRYVLLRYSNGNIVDPRSCPAGRMDPAHWHRIDSDVEPGTPNMVCTCEVTS